MSSSFWADHISVLACPDCKGCLDLAQANLTCARCGHLWPCGLGFPEFVRGRNERMQFYDTQYWPAYRPSDVSALDNYLVQTADKWLAQLGVRSGSMYLDVSCGQGHALVAGHLRGATGFGVEFSRTALCGARQKFGLDSTVLADATKLPFHKEVFDTLSCFGALEHFLRLPEALSEFRRVTTPQAKFLFVVPNSRHILLPLLKLVDRQPVETMFDLEGWRIFLAAHGFAVLDWSADNHTYGRPLFPFSLKSLARKCLVPVTNLAGSERAWQFSLLCAKQPLGVTCEGAHRQATATAC